MADYSLTVPAGTTRLVVETDPQTRPGFEYRLEAGSNTTIVIPVAKTAEITRSLILAGRGATVTCIGLAVLNGRDEALIHTLQRHDAPDTTSYLHFNSVLSGDSRLTYDGGIFVAPAARKTDAYQRNENLLLSEGADVRSKPALEILANDVRCTHGATVSAVDPDQLYYLTTRGISPDRAVSLIARGFIAKLLSRISDAGVRRTVEDITDRWL
ncbi:hypothetical protein A2Z33_02470 [Candidatus Gottesmanbacteria bacterium RBG_16_52_11]|uniref:SUF system FeS cluster assembly SufBD core domain-containing protein n=1 Tax=Candidatus Gottesmanbacteria bacterium RBG_16_52_11 TaxID=1798374 RepID=A0A1F5YML3_9BACT|nr:MAG: hypothetical protein A2Z33_02470 [Candidatus Gottesmanbacteria bacterium RBG_16_52_11]